MPIRGCYAFASSHTKMDLEEEIIYMEEKIITLRGEELEYYGRNVMVSMAQGASSPEAGENVLRLAGQVQQEYIEDIVAKIKVKYLDADSFNGYQVKVGDTVIESDYLGNIPIENVAGIALYGISLQTKTRDFGGDDIGKIYVDLWETAYAEGCLSFVEDDIIGEREVFLTPALGPGYYGLSQASVKEFCRALGSEDIGITVNVDGIMIPPKSLVGMFIMLKEYGKTVGTACDTCIGSKKGCSSCTICTQQL